MPPTRFNAGVATPAPEVVTTNRTLTREDNGKTFFADAVDLVFTLPPTEAGLTFTFITKTLSASTGVQVSPNAADQIIGNGFTPADDKDAINTAATDAVQDTLTIVGDGSLGWYITGIKGTWARQA